MDKKNLKWYEAPAMELINMNVEGQLMAGSPTGGGSDIIGEDAIEDGFFGN